MATMKPTLCGGRAVHAPDCGEDGNCEYYAERAEAWAVGTVGGDPVPSYDLAYENNSKYWAEQSALSASESAESAIESTESATQAKGHAETAEQAAEEVTNALGQVMSKTTGIFTQTFTTSTDTDTLTFNPTGYTYSANDDFDVYISGLRLNPSEFSWTGSGSSATITLVTPVTHTGTVIEVVANTSSQMTTDATLTIQGAAADAKATGDGINQLKEDLTTITGNDVIRFTTKKFIALNDSTAKINNMQTPSGNCNCAVVTCSEGDKFTIYATGGNSARAWGFVDANGTILAVAGGGANANGLVLTAPANATHLVINDNSAPPSISYVGDGVLVDNVNSITSKLNAYGIVSANRFNKNDPKITNGVYLNTGSGTTSGNSSYSTSDFIDISDLKSVAMSYVHIYCFYNASTGFISGGSNSGWAANDYSVSVPENAKYVRISYANASVDTVQVGTGVSRDAYIAYDAKFDFPKLRSTESVIVVAKDGTGDYTSFTEAIYETWNSGIDVVVKQGTYDIEAEYVALFGQTVVDEMTDSTDLSGFQFGVRLANRKVRFESGAFLVCDWSSHTISGTRRFSAIRVDANVEIDGMNLDVTGAFYAVHDDYGPNQTPFTNKYENCKIVGHSLYNANCIGGGCKRYSRHILNNCYFDNGRTNVTTVRYHNYALNQDAYPVIWVSNCYFNSLFTPRWAGSQTTKMKVYVNNCHAEAIYKLAEGTSTNDNIELYKWNNEETNPQS